MGLLFLNLSPLRDFSRIPKILAKMIADAKGWFRSVAVSVWLFYSEPVDYPLVSGFIVSRVPLTWPEFKLLMWPFQCCSLGGSGCSVQPALSGTGALHYTKSLIPFENDVLPCQGRAIYIKCWLLLLIDLGFQNLGVNNPEFYFPIHRASVGRSLQLTPEQGSCSLGTRHSLTEMCELLWGFKVCEKRNRLGKNILSRWRQHAAGGGRGGCVFLTAPSTLHT